MNVQEETNKDKINKRYVVYAIHWLNKKVKMKLSALDIIEIAKEYNVEILNKNQYLMILNRSRKLPNNIKRMIIKITEETIVNINGRIKNL